jgi:16S rRNA (adenine1518-N6/adenine1519-N6)-dimethyltransferase
MTLSEMRKILAKGDVQLTKSLGQNFLHDANQLRRIVAAAELAPGDQVLEIGPGLGPLTELLLAEPVTVLAMEIDHRLCAFLKERFAAVTNLTLEHADALESLRKDQRDFRQYKLVANLPYSVASPIMVELALSAGRPERMVVTLQREVARRLIAKPDSDDYGVLTLLLQLDYLPGASFVIPASCFFPMPAVDSACVCLRRRPAPLVDDAERKRFVRVVKRGFSQRRKMMFKLLKQEWPEDSLRTAFASLGISPLARAESLGLETFVGLTRQLASTT